MRADELRPGDRVMLPDGRAVPVLDVRADVVERRPGLGLGERVLVRFEYGVPFWCTTSTWFVRAVPVDPEAEGAGIEPARA